MNSLLYLFGVSCVHMVLDYIKFTSELSRMREYGFTDIVGGATAMSFGKKEFAPGSVTRYRF